MSEASTPAGAAESAGSAGSADGAGPAESTNGGTFITLDALLEHFLGHRRLTRRVLEAFPEGELFVFRIGGMRSFGEIVHELLRVSEPLVRGVATRAWDAPDQEGGGPATKADLLEAWDRSTAAIEEQWARITPERLLEEDVAFGMYEGLTRDHVLYALDNEVHHRGQGYVYLRALGVEPPAFWER
jgi:uncharacterized damage-inducible protein DinB